jgi:hypothetical protein
MNTLLLLERTNGIRLPEIYKNFYLQCSISLPSKLAGTDLVNNRQELRQWAIELLNENNIENFLCPNDFGFMMHQGYMFYYFKADTDPDPIVFGYREPNVNPESFGTFSNFIKAYL